MLLVQLLLVLRTATAVDPQTRSAHWVIRTSKLEATLDFLKQVLGMRVLRHEENDEPCPITCNGDSPTAWSKTMVGYETEDKAWCEFQSASIEERDRRWMGGDWWMVVRYIGCFVDGWMGSWMD